MALNEYEDDDAALLVELESDTPDEGEPSAEAPKPPKEKPEVPTEGEPQPDAGEEEEPYGRRVQKRINQLTKKTRELEQETQFWREKVLALEEQTKAQMADTFAKELSQSEQQLTAQIDSARAAKRKAIEEGDIDAQIRADEQLLDLRDQLAEKRRKAEALKRQPAEEFVKPKTPPAASDPTANLPEGTRGWLKANPWFMDGADPRAAEIARALDVELQEEGYSPDDPDMYVELDKRLSAVVPRRARAAPAKPAASAPPAQRPSRSPVAASSADGQGPAPTKPSRRLTQDDLATMRRWGLDPRSESDRRAWLKRNDL